MTISHFKLQSQKQNHLRCNQAAFFLFTATAAKRKFTVSVHNLRMSCAVVLYDVNSDSRRALCASIHEGELPSGERKTATVRGDWERVGDEKWQGENRNCGSQTWAPTLSSPHTFPIICLGMSRRSLSLSCISAAQSDATVPSKSAIATSRACSVSHTDTGVYTTYEGSGGDCQGEEERGVGGCNFWKQRLSFFHLKHTTNLTSLYVNKLTSDSCCL